MGSARQRLAALLVAVSAAACGDVSIRFDSGYCDGESRYAVIVEFQARSDGRPVAVVADGVIKDGRYEESMVPVRFERREAWGASQALAGGRDRPGVYDVKVETAHGEVFNWYRVQAFADFCGPRTTVLRASLARY